MANVASFVKRCLITPNNRYTVTEQSLLIRTYHPSINSNKTVFLKIVCYSTWENFGRGKTGKSWAICQNIPCQYLENISWHMHWPALSPNFSLPIAFTCMVHQNFTCEIFPMYGIILCKGPNYIINVTGWAEMGQVGT